METPWFDPEEAERQKALAGNLSVGALQRTMAVTWLIEHGLASERKEPPSPSAKKGSLRLVPIGDWDPPDLNGVAPPAPFPLDVLPDGLASYVRDVSEIFPCPADYLALPALAIAGAGIGRSLALVVKDSWIEAPLLFAATIGPAGSVKSPALKLISAPVYGLSVDLLVEREIELENVRERGKDRKGKRDGDDAAPPLKRIVMGDATCEAIARILAENPRGMIMIHDELAGWLNGMNQYKSGSGNDRQFWLQIWPGAPIYIDRVGNEGRIPVVVRHPFLPIVGPITPAMLDSLSDGQRDDGFMDRILFAYPECVPTRWSWRSVSKLSMDGWDRSFRLLWARPLRADHQGRDCPAFVRFEPGALRMFADWFDRHCAETEAPDFPPFLVGPWAKLRAYCARLALILDQLHWSYGPAADPDQDPRHVSDRAVSGAIRLVDDYFKAHFRRTVATLRPIQSDNADARAILLWAITRGKPSFSGREAQNNFRRRFEERPDDFPIALRWLIQRGAIRKVPPPLSQGGRRARETYDLNPYLLQGRAQNAQNSEVV